MNHVVVVEKNKDGKIELTKDELQKMLDDAYNKGHTEGRSRYETITYPSNPWPWYTTTATSNITLNSSVDAESNQ